MILHVFQQVGLNENESKIYLSLLELGVTHAGRIIKITGLPRATVYDGLDRLIRKGLVNKSQKADTTLFTAEEPERLEDMLESQEKTLTKAKRNLDAIMPQLRKLKNPHMNLPSVRTYEGLEGIRTVLNDSLNAKEIVYTYVNVEDMSKHISQINDEYLEKRKMLKIHKRGLIVDSPKAREFSKHYDQSVSEGRFLDRNIIPFHIEMNIYDGKVSYLTYRDKHPIGVIIEDNDIYRIHRSTFELLWVQSESMQ